MSRLVLGLLLLFALAAVVVPSPPAGAQQPAQAPAPAVKSPLGIATPPVAGGDRAITGNRSPLGAGGTGQQTQSAAPQPTTAFGRAWLWIEQQRAYFNRQMSGAVRSLKTDPLGGALMSLVFICFAYGVLHAAGPGHGKGVISAYALANNETVKRGVILSFLSALIQAFSAIAIFAVLTLALNARKTDFDRVESWLETASWALVAGIGAWLLLARVGGLMGWRVGHSHGHSHGHAQASAGHPHDHSGHPHSPAHGHRHDHAAHAHGPVHPVHSHVHSHQHSHAVHQHAPGEACTDCGHLHIPTPDQIQGPWSWRRAFAIAASVGIRPCTGALILLAFCAANGLLWAGILGTLAMSLGTAITISTLAVLAVGSRDALAWLGGGESRWGRMIGNAAGIAGAALILVMGSMFFVMSLNGSGPL